jgi:hypothetical protein
VLAPANAFPGLLLTNNAPQHLQLLSVCHPLLLLLLLLLMRQVWW